LDLSEGLREIENNLDTLEVPAIFKASFLLFKKIFDFDDAITTQDELNEYLVDNYGWGNATLEDILDDDEYLKEKYDKMLNYINKGYGILDMSVDYGNDTMYELLNNLPEEDSEIILIENDC
jgi:DNA helicase HerA-like ATPase